MNHNKITNNSEKIRQAHVLYSGANASAIKRSSSNETNDNVNNKKIRIDVGASSTCDQINKVQQKKRSESDMGDSLQQVQSNSPTKFVTVNVNSTGAARTDELAIRNISSTNVGDISSSLNSEEVTDEYTLIRSNISEYANMTESAVNSSCKSLTITNSSVNQSSSTSLLETVPCPKVNSSTNTFPSKDNTESTAHSTDTTDVIVPIATASDEIELVMLPSVQESKATAIPLNIESAPQSVASIGLRNVTSNNLVRHGTVTYSRIGTGNHTTSTTAVLNRVNIQSPLKNQPLMVTAKKLVSEVTQKTAKVSIGNTTISVPLLKPLNSTQLIQSSSLTGEIQKHSQSSTYASPHSQTQLNLSKILNVKRSSKGNHPTIVSLSQLQIKPVSSAKIVQAKVVSKKLSQVSPVVPSHLQANTGVVTITASKPKQNIANNVNYPKMSQLSLMQEVTSSNKVLENEHKAAEESISEITMISTDNKQNIGKNESNAANIEPSLPIVTLDKNTGTDENISTTTKLNSVSANMPPLLTPLSKQADQQSNTSQHHSIRPAVSIIKQNAPQLITTSATSTCVSTSAVASECNLQTELLSAKSSFQQHFNNNNNNSGKLNSTPLIIPRNISLMLAKNNISQQSKTTLVSTKSVNSAEQRVKQMNLSVSNAVNISTVSLPQANCFVSQPSDPSIKQTVISVAVQPFNIMNISDQNSRKAFKISSFGQNSDKRSNSINDEDQQSRLISSRIRPNLEILSSNRVCTTENQKDTLSEVSAIVKTGGPASSDALITTTFEKANTEANLLSVSTSQAINQITLLKPEETHNVLLKQLLQNSYISHNTSQALTSTSNASSINSVSSATSICSNVLSARKVINVRAPSLGLVSSLEAQLARPVIPPVPANTVATTNHKSEAQQKSHKNDSIENSTTDCENDTIQNDFKLKSSVHVISKETSFVSSPNIKCNLSLESLEPALGDGKNIPLPTNTSSIEINQHHSTEPEGKQSSEFNSDIHNIHTSSGLATNNTSTIATQIRISTPRPVVTKNHPGDHPRSINEKSISGAICSPLEKKTNNLCIQSNPADNLNISNTAFNQEPSVTGDDLNCSNMSPKYQNNLKGITDQTAKFRNTVKHLEVLTDEHVMGNTFPAGTNSKPSQLMDNFNAERSQITIDKLKSAVKDVELRKKRKREYQKHRRQLLSNNKDVTLNSVSPNLSSSRKRARKLSKMEEDYDNFINNLMAHVRQMQPLQVLEPLLNRNFGICSIFGMRSFSRVSNNKENDEKFFDQHVLSEYGSIKFMHRMALYDEKRFSGLDIAKETQPFTIQNDFYDQEFSPAIYNDEMNKLIRFSKTIRERNTETLEIISNNNEISYDRKSAVDIISENLSQFIYPGLVLNNINNQYSGPMSPIVSFVKPISSKKSWNIVKKELTSNLNTKEYTSEELHTLRCETDSKTQTVTLSLSSSAAENIFGVLKDLANLLHITPPSTYKITKAPINLLTKQCSKGGRSKIKSSSKYIHLQNILSGRRKMCCNCGQAVGTIGIRANRDGSISTSSPMSSIRKHFCCKICYEQFKCRGNNYGVNSIKHQTSVKLHQETINSNISMFFDAMNNIERIKDNKLEQKAAQKQCFKYFADNCFYGRSQLKRTTEKEITDTLLKMDITVSPHNESVVHSNLTPIEDTRQCVFCNQRGDGLADGPSRLLNFDVDKWVHLNCALWSNGVYETISGGLMNFKGALQMGLNQSCSFCQKLGATVKCFKNRCGLVFHLPCAIKEHCAFYKNKTMHCHQHTSRTEKENELISLAVYRRVFVDRDENRQVASVMHHSELSNLLRVGSLTFLNVGQLLPHQLESFHSVNNIYPIGYKVIRFYWSIRRPNKRCRYICSIAEVAGRPEFRILVQEYMENDIELRDSSLKGVWQKIVEPISAMRKENKLIQSFPQFISGEDLFGLTEPSVVRIIESLPGIETLTDYRFKYGRNPLLELPLAINPSGAARTEQKQRQVLGWRKPQTQRTGTTCNQRIANTTTSIVAGEVACPYSKQFVHSKSSQYKKMKQEWRNNVCLARSKIQGLGLYAARDIEKHTMIIEYIGEVIRTEVSEIREKQFEAKNRGIYMFRLDEERVVDATLSGGLARYINHACNPNCVTETVDVDRELRIIIFAKRRINRGEELSYDYKFDIEDDAHKIPCMCGAPNCRKWMN